jgi:hypothetical protein
MIFALFNINKCCFLVSFRRLSISRRRSNVPFDVVTSRAVILVKVSIDASLSCIFVVRVFNRETIILEFYKRAFDLGVAFFPDDVYQVAAIAIGGRRKLLE